MDRVGQLWEHSSILLLVIRKTEKGTWTCLKIADGGYSPHHALNSVHNYAEEFFTSQEWWTRVA